MIFHNQKNILSSHKSNIKHAKGEAMQGYTKTNVTKETKEMKGQSQEDHCKTCSLAVACNHSLRCAGHAKPMRFLAPYKVVRGPDFPLLCLVVGYHSYFHRG